MSRDRLAEFYQKAKITGDEEQQPPNNLSLANINGNLENGETVIEIPESDENDMHKTFIEVSDTTKMIEDLTTDVEKVKLLHSKILASPISDKQMKADLDDLMSIIKTSSQVIRAKLKEMKEANFQAEEEDKGSASVRIRKIQHSALQQSFIDAMYQYQFAQNHYREKCKARIKRQISITGSNLSEEEVEKMIEGGNISIFTRSIIMETKQAKQMLEDVEARHKDILKLEQSLLDLHGLFSELAMFVESQDLVVNNIAASVLSTENYVAKAKEETKKAKEFKKKVMKKTICIVLTITFILLIIALILTLHFCKVF